MPFVYAVVMVDEEPVTRRVNLPMRAVDLGAPVGQGPDLEVLATTDDFWHLFGQYPRAPTVRTPSRAARPPEAAEVALADGHDPSTTVEDPTAPSLPSAEERGAFASARRGHPVLIEVNR